MLCCSAPCKVSVYPFEESTTEPVKPTEKSTTEPGKPTEESTTEPEEGNSGMLVKNDVIVETFCLTFAYIIFV